MVDFLHCNKCLETKNVKLILGQCFHVNCDKCIMKEPSRVCPICKKSTKYVPIDATMPDSLKIYFSDAAGTFQKEMSKLQKQLGFQNGMATRLLDHLKKEVERKKKLEQMMRERRGEEENMKKEYEKMRKWMETAEQSLKKYEEEKSVLIQRISELETSDFPGISDQTSKFRFLESEAGSEISCIPSSNSSFNFISSSNGDSELFKDVDDQHFDPPNQHFDPPNQHFDPPFLTPKITESKKFVNIFNNMITPSRQFPKISTTNSSAIADKTSFSLDDRTNILNTLERSRRETSLPMSSNYTRNSDNHLSQRERMFPKEIRELRRNATQKGTVTRNSIIPASYLNLD